MKTQLSLLAICLCGIGIANAQTTTNTYSSTANSTNVSPVTTDSTNAVNSTNSTMSNGNATMTNGTMNSGNSSTNLSTSSTDGTTTTGTYSTTDRPERTKSSKDYKNFVFGVYAGLNTTKFKGETTNTGGDVSGRLGYQAGFFVRGGGRLFGQLGAEYFASSSNYFTKGDGQTVKSIQDQIDIKYIQIPLYIGYKVLQSDRGISAIRVQAGIEYANRISSSSGQFNLTNAEIKSGTFNGLGQLGFDIGPLLIDLTYHYGFGDSIKNPITGTTGSTGFAGSQRRVLSASVGFKF